jgi:hypothetical protein
MKTTELLTRDPELKMKNGCNGDGDLYTYMIAFPVHVH